MPRTIRFAGIMRFRFRRSVRLLPGVRLNICKTGTSVSVGGRGATVNISKRGVYGTAGIPGTGFSVRERLDTEASSANANASPAKRSKLRPWMIAVAVVVGSIVWTLLS